MKINQILFGLIVGLLLGVVGTCQWLCPKAPAPGDVLVPADTSRGHTGFSGVPADSSRPMTIPEIESFIHEADISSHGQPVAASMLAIPLPVAAMDSPSTDPGVGVNWRRCCELLAVKRFLTVPFYDIRGADTVLTGDVFLGWTGAEKLDTIGISWQHYRPEVRLPGPPLMGYVQFSAWAGPQVALSGSLILGRKHLLGPSYLRVGADSYYGGTVLFNFMQRR